MAYALRFIAGKYKGGEFPLRPNREIIVGRGSEFDMVLDEDMVSRRHAKLATYHGQIVLQDLKSTNGTFVNGERITVARLKTGDKVLVGSSIMELIEVELAGSHVPRDSGVVALNVPKPNQTTQEATAQQIAAVLKSHPQAKGVPPLPPSPTRPAVRPTINQATGMSGRFPDDGVTIADLIELFVNSSRTGTLVLTDPRNVVGSIDFRDGAITHARIEVPNRPPEVCADVDPIKCFNRLLTWTQGTFLMTGSAPALLPNEITMNSRELLMEGMRQFDELQRFAGHLPPDDQILVFTVPLEPRLSALSAEALDTLQIIINFGEVGLVLDHSEATDLETYQDLLYLIQSGYVSAK